MPGNLERDDGCGDNRTRRIYRLRGRDAAVYLAHLYHIASGQTP